MQRILQFSIILVFFIIMLYYYYGSAKFLQKTTKVGDKFLEMKQVYVSQSQGRKQLLSDVANVDFGLLYNVVVPEVHCPTLVRIGNLGDGGKWICNPFSLSRKNKCAIFSLGINNDITFDLAFQEATGQACTLYAFDKQDQNNNVKQQLDKVNAKFKIACLGNTDDPKKNEYTIGSLLKYYHLSAIEILKIDIEGAEFQVMPDILGKSNICQILIEIHSSPSKTLKLLKEIASYGYYLFSYEINGYHHNLAEYSFIHKSCMEKYDTRLLAAYLS